MAFFHGMVMFFKRGAKLSPSEHRITFEESSGQRPEKKNNGSITITVYPSAGSNKETSSIPKLEILKKKTIILLRVVSKF